MAKMFAQQSVEIKRAFDIGGENADLSNIPLFKYLTRLGMGASGARDIIETGSHDVVAGMQKLNQV